MELKNRCLFSSSSSASLFLLVFFILSSVSASAPTFISGSIFREQASIGRNLLQAKKACPVNFEYANYTIILRQCKGPQYRPDLCCGALKEFACPYAEELNDVSNDCATIMFSYINLYGKYPPGLFSSECKEGKLGLACPSDGPSESESASGSWIIQKPSPFLVFTTGLLVLLLPLF